MRHLRILTLVASALALAACNASTLSDNRVRASALQDAPAELLRACARPGEIPAGTATQAQVERLWGRDRANLVSCRARHAAATGYYLNRDARLRGER